MLCDAGLRRPKLDPGRPRHAARSRRHCEVAGRSRLAWSWPAGPGSRGRGMRRHEAGSGGALRRREFLRAGLLGFGGLTLPQLMALRARAADPGAGERTALIVVLL